MPLLYALLFFLVTLSILVFIGRHDFSLTAAILAAIIGYLLGRVRSLRFDLNELRKDVDALKQNQADTRSAAQTVSDYEPSTLIETNEVSKEIRLEKPIAPDVVTTQPIVDSGLLDKAFNTVKQYFTSGNLFVRVGILILFFGVSFLLKYVSDKGLFPIEYRLVGVAIGAFLLLATGWFLRFKNATYGLLLQGAGIGIFYLDIFAAYSLYSLIPPLFSFALLFAVSLLTVALAVMQNSLSLAFIGFSGGFLAPVLTSSGSGNYIGLFNYYAVLNVAIAIIAWFKSWRLLNLLGFGFTFTVALLWGSQHYTVDKLFYVEAFLIFFFLLYLGITVLYALRKKSHHDSLNRYVDGSLLFGVPMGMAAFQYYLLQDTSYGIAISSFSMGLLYLIISQYVWFNGGRSLRLLVEGLLAVGIVFTTLAIPFAVTSPHSASAWALEGAGLVWFGIRQQRLSMRLFGYFIQLGAVVFVLNYLLSNLNAPIQQGDVVFLNGLFISLALIGLSAVITAYLLFRHKQNVLTQEWGLSIYLLIGGVIGFVAGGMIDIYRFIDRDWWGTSHLLLLTSISVSFGLLALKTQWRSALWVSISLLPAMLYVPLLFQSHLSEQGGWLVWPLAFAVLYFMFYRVEKGDIPVSIGSESGWYPKWQSGTLLFIVLLLVLEGLSWLSTLTISKDYRVIWVIVPVLAAWWLIHKPMFWPFTTRHLKYASMGLFWIMLAWLLYAVISIGKPVWYQWLPVWNLTDLLTFLVLFSLAYGLSKAPNNDYQLLPKIVEKVSVITVVSGVVFIWLNFTLFRAAHYWWGLPYDLRVLLDESFLQMSLSILWAFMGVLLTIIASRKQWRSVWIGGSLILSVVVLKLFLFDLSQINALARIISFMVVGALLMSIGYFAPIPTKDQSKNE